MAWLFTGLATLFGTIFRSVLASGFIRSVTHAFVTFGLLKMFTVLGLAFITYTGTQFTLDFAYDAMSQQFASMPGEAIWGQVIFMAAYELRIDDVLTNIFTAYSAAFALKTMKTASNLISTV